VVSVLLLLAMTIYAQQPAIDTRVGHTDSVNDIAFSPDGKVLISA
jgi:WD40 repeat protein